MTSNSERRAWLGPNHHLALATGRERLRALLGHMDMMQGFLATVVACAVLAACAAETFTEVETSRSELISGFESYTSRDEVIPGVTAQYQVAVIEDSSLPPGERRPPFEIYTLSVMGFRHLDHEGELRIRFFNNRLEQTWFYPNNPESYLSLLKSQRVLPADNREVIVGYTVIGSALDYRGKRYVAWTDKRLREQSKRWISQYA